MAADSNGSFNKWCRNLLFLASVVGIFATVIWGMSSTIALNNRVHQEFAVRDAESIADRTEIRKQLSDHALKIAEMSTDLKYIKAGVDEIKSNLHAGNP